MAVDDNVTEAITAGFNGASGSVQVLETDKTGVDFHGKGTLEYVGEHHLQFAETGEYFLKAGADRWVWYLISFSSHFVV